MSGRTVTVGAVQCALGGARGDNIARVEHHVREAAAGGARIILVPELFEGPYFCREENGAHFAEARDVAEDEAVARMREIARELGVVVPVSFFESAGPAFYNSVAMVDADGAILGVYRKSHIPDGPGYEEKFYFHPGDTGFRVWSTKHGKLGVGICWDQWFPESARAMMLLGAEDPFVPHGHRQRAARAGARHARSVAARHDRARRVRTWSPHPSPPNRTGEEGGQRFYGSSFIANPRGDKVAELGRDDEGVVVASFDLDAQARARASWGFFRDRRPDLYGLLDDRRRAAQRVTLRRRLRTAR